MQAVVVECHWSNDTQYNLSHSHDQCKFANGFKVREVSETATSALDCIGAPSMRNYAFVWCRHSCARRYPARLRSHRPFWPGRMRRWWSANSRL